MHKNVSAGHFANGRKYPALIMRTSKNLSSLLSLRQLFACGNSEGGEEFVVIFISAIAKNSLRSGSGDMEKGDNPCTICTFCVYNLLKYIFCNTFAETIRMFTNKRDGENVTPSNVV